MRRLWKSAKASRSEASRARRKGFCPPQAYRVYVEDGRFPQQQRHAQLINGLNRRSSYKGHTVNALVPEGDEGRSELRKAAGSRKQALIRGYPNGATHCG